jgi:parallel beta-helix repeat protein
MKITERCMLLFLIGLIGRISANQIVVSTTNDSGTGSFRQAIRDSRFTSGPDTILFHIPQTDLGFQTDTGTWIIRPLTFLDNIQDDSLFIDGTSQSDYIGTDTNPYGPEVVIDGSLLGSEVDGLHCEADFIRINHLIFHGFPEMNLVIGGNFCQITGCYIGMDPTGMKRVAASSSGLLIYYGKYNLIGGENEEDRNIISGNGASGIYLTRARYNRIQNNIIGLNRNETDTLGNGTGISLYNSSQNIIGPDNIISGNNGHGLSIVTDESDSNTVVGNKIGTDRNGEAAMPNLFNGIQISQADYNIIGGSGGDRNIISGNIQSGLYILDADSNVIAGNTIGAGSTGDTALPNGDTGILIHTGRGNQIGLLPGPGNLISGNLKYGLNMNGESEGNQITGNLIGPDITGNQPLPNGYDAVYLSLDAHDNVIGHNTIAFSKEEGILLLGSNVIRNTITRNRFFSNTRQAIRLNGANQSITPPVLTLSNPVNGYTTAGATVEIFSTPDNEALDYEGTVTANSEGFFTWPGSPQGPFITATATDSQGNTSELSLPRFTAEGLVTTTADSGTGSLRWAMTLANTNAGPDTIRFDIPDNDLNFDGTVWTIRPQSPLPLVSDSSTVIDGNTQTLNQGDRNAHGPELMLDGRSAGAQSTAITIKSSHNEISYLIISGFDGSGIQVSGTKAHHNRIRNNYFGTTADGMASLANGYGIEIMYCKGGNTIGGADHEGNLISGNLAHGIVIYTSPDNIIQGNFIGLTQDGLNALPNGQVGIDLQDAERNRIGGPETEESNLISGNGLNGIRIYGTECRNNEIYGNWIGLSLDGESLIPNQWSGIQIQGGASHNIIGNEMSGYGNLICGNDPGVDILGEGSDLNVIAGNSIGTNTNRFPMLGNQAGITVHNGSSNNRIGPANLITGNESYGIRILDENTLYNTITENLIYNNGEHGILLDNGGNGSITKPVITGVNPLTGAAPSNSRIEIFSDEADEGEIYEGFTMSDGTGHFSYGGPVTGPRLTVTATDPNGNTSEFSSAVLLSGLVVTHCGDQGEHSLRWAIIYSNEHEGPDTILFDLSETDPNFDGQVWWIYPKTQLPVLSDSGTVISGLSQTELHGNANSAGPEIVLCGDQMTEDGNGLIINGYECEVNGLAVGGFSSYGFNIGGNRNTIRGNYIGVHPYDLQALPNFYGIYCRGDENTFGGYSSANRNIISGNQNDGLSISNGSRNRVIGNFIGMDPSGTAALMNGTGIRVTYNSRQNIIGGSDPAARNIISGNGSIGVQFSDEQTDENVLTGNYIGTDTSGTVAIENSWRGVYISNGAKRNIIGGPQRSDGNLISGNNWDGIRIAGADTDSNLIQNNLIGTDCQGTSGLRNAGNGIELSSGPMHTRILENVISGNGQAGLFLRGAGTDSNQVTDNFIGLDITGLQPLPNETGIIISDKAKANRIRTNIISGNKGDGIIIVDDSTWANQLSANWIGLDVTGQDTLPNGSRGILVSAGADRTLIGGESAEMGNIIAANHLWGIYIGEYTTDAVQITHNRIGTDITGTKAYGNGNHGISVNGREHQIEHNLISGNRRSGVTLRDSTGGIKIQYNLIGVQSDSISPLPNAEGGIRIEKNAVMDTIGPENRIWYNNGFAVLVIDSTSHEITVTGNSISRNQDGGIGLFNGANLGIQPPVILSTAPVHGTALSDSRVEVFADSGNQGLHFLGWTISQSNGQWSWEGLAEGLNITATVTDQQGNTSAFSVALPVSISTAESTRIPSCFYLAQNYPNPFNPETTIEFGLPGATRVSLEIFDLLGCKIVSLLDKKLAAGVHRVRFNASSLASGMYFYRIQTPEFRKIRKLVVVK